jgi:hypothetical protein
LGLAIYVLCGARASRRAAAAAPRDAQTRE